LFQWKSEGWGEHDPWEFSEKSRKIQKIQLNFNRTFKISII
jgi:hypothetical protein